MRDVAHWGIAAALALASCGGGDGDGAAGPTSGGSTSADATSGGSGSADPASGDEAGDLSFRAACMTFFTRQRDCAEGYIPQLVALRVRLDRPAGIAARDASEGREALVEQARSEYADDSTDEAIGAFCDGLTGRTPADEQVEAARGFEGCAAERSCEAFIPCDLALLEAHWASASP